MLSRIKREKVLAPSARVNLYEYDSNLPMGSWVVWWYGRLIKNFADNTVPLVIVTLQRVDGDLLTEEFETCQIAISRLRFYPQGLILEDRLPVARIALETLWFKVGFGYKDWNFRTAKELHRRSSKHELSLPVECANDWSLEFKQSEGALMLNCVDYLVRGYSIRSEIPRILTTYGWHEAKSRLLKHDTPSSEKNLPDSLVVYPHPDMVKEDEVFLALLANDDRRTRRAAESIFSEIDTPASKRAIRTLSKCFHGSTDQLNWSAAGSGSMAARILFAWSCAAISNPPAKDRQPRLSSKQKGQTRRRPKGCSSD
ncbi:hypothetical protein JFU48_25675 [Pseudomonas sp. TH49]|uniref:hypothetical protein n=1 Tax=Pseudomonas sp. TH49 TaxID=2796413 RepID=UPI0019137C9F|nr:hypothetical protein [Pseudomonas sp. TH49]MBK5344739.1 hypothetical protein [Pseudomonas sp. TH49]